MSTSKRIVKFRQKLFNKFPEEYDVYISHTDGMKADRVEVTFGKKKLSRHIDHMFIDRVYNLDAFVNELADKIIAEFKINEPVS